MRLSSFAFEPETQLPDSCALENQNLSPPLKWFDVPPETQTLALICEDPDAPSARLRGIPFSHWVLYNLPANLRGLREGVPQQEKLGEPWFAAQGINSFGLVGYCGPRPPVGDGRHRYVFRLFALGKTPTFPPKLTREVILSAFEDCEVLAEAKLTGMYERKREGASLSRSA